jgi:hypothetical protein
LIFKTRFRELGIQNQGPGNWRYIDRTTGQAVGGPRRSKVEAFADLQRYAEEYGATLETNAPSRRTMARNPKVTVFAGNPSRRRTVQRQQSSRVYEIAYKHNEDGKAYKHTFKPGVCLELLSDGSIRIYSRTGKPLWRNFT